jgi:hypothetical protein
MLDTSKLEGKLRELGVELGEMEVKGGMRRCFERMRDGGELGGESQSGEVEGKGVWMGKENESEKKQEAHERVGGEMV